jgi:hypothetical protein
MASKTKTTLLIVKIQYLKMSTAMKTKNELAL